MDAIGPLQLRVMHYIWKHGPSTVHAVHDALNGEPSAPKLAYTTILTVMRNLARRKILNQKASGRSHIFEPLVDEDSYKLSILRKVRNELFSGDVNRLLDFLSRDDEIETEKRDQIAHTLHV
ncbi:MAG: BlaI/MecI/CopY family transcriptional regulator [Planctomycetes bacterium]|nr:BlaI/MecI/CopY family transcriptional regulator [Planctomycetota bacterium]